MSARKRDLNVRRSCVIILQMVRIMIAITHVHNVECIHNECVPNIRVYYILGSSDGPDLRNWGFATRNQC